MIRSFRCFRRSGQSGNDSAMRTEEQYNKSLTFPGICVGELTQELFPEKLPSDLAKPAFAFDFLGAADLIQIGR